MEHSTVVRLLLSWGLLLAFALWEAALPRRARTQSRWARWPTNLALAVIGAIVVRVAFGGAAVGVAEMANVYGRGLFRVWELPEVVVGAVGILLLDLLVYWQHRVTHRLPILWRLHKVHHADRELDVTSGVRFHPVEILLSMGLKMAFVFALGIPAWAVVVFEALLNGTAQFNHSNLSLPLGIDRWLRYVLVTPDMHRIHHSRFAQEHDSNYGFCLSLWDRLFRSYRQDPHEGQLSMRLGLEEVPLPVANQLGNSLLLPFGK